MEWLAFAVAVAVVALAGVAIGLTVAGRLTRWTDRADADPGGGDDASPVAPAGTPAPPGDAGWRGDALDTEEGRADEGGR